MNRSTLYFSVALSGFLTLTACTMGKSQKSGKDHHKHKEVKYEEDLRGSRIKYQVQEDKKTTADAATVNKVQTPPSRDVTKELSLKMDSIARKNQNLRFAEGYRIQVYSGPSREEAYRARDRVLDILPSVDVYPLYRSPVFRVSVGDYAERLEANNAFVKLKREFPNAILVPARINIVQLK
ncbi:MAG: SPOR domain-containing protein [Cytophagaceae bacterium]